MRRDPRTPAHLRDLPGPPGWPLIGNLNRIRLDPLHATLEGWAGRYGPLDRIRVGPRRVAVLSDRASIERILVERPHGFRRARSLEAAAEGMGLKGVFAAEGEDWRRQRRIVAAALRRARIEDFFPRLGATVERLRRRWEGAADTGEPVDLCRDLMRFTVDATVQFAFGLDPNTLETGGPAIQRHLDSVFPVLHWRVNAPWRYWRLVRLPSDRALAALRKEVAAMVAVARARLDAKPGRRDVPRDFLEAIVAAADVGEFTDAEIFANAGTLLLAGEDTTANTIAWTVHLLADYPAWLERCRREADEVIAPSAGIEAAELATRLPVLDAVCNEAMRLKPVAPLHVVEPLADSEIMGCLIPGGTPIMMPVRRMATRDEHFRDGGRFDPDRWLLPRESRPVPHDDWAFVPSGAGSRLCPRRHLALLEIRTVLAMLYRNFEVEPVAGPAVEEKLAFTMVPANLFVRLGRRTPGRSARRLRAFAAAPREPVSSLERRRPMR